MLKIIAGAALVLAGLYFAIRLMELDRVNRETPNQEDPLPGDEVQHDG